MARDRARISWPQAGQSAGPEKDVPGFHELESEPSRCGRYQVFTELKVAVGEDQRNGEDNKRLAVAAEQSAACLLSISRRAFPSKEAQAGDLGQLVAHMLEAGQMEFYGCGTQQGRRPRPPGEASPIGSTADSSKLHPEDESADRRRQHQRLPCVLNARRQRNQTDPAQRGPECAE